ncbi:hypothetical protein B0H63DRAFT_150279 [Podospora didyma]|uniref:Uncharacterized protein n=1 Tax=Podospora didyma TaxID=330526 RepID=A0AAE0U1I4_9PEZI|nr:hypothetical protein B0H63DRAFT_150279 [Podospora didyma]
MVIGYLTCNRIQTKLHKMLGRAYRRFLMLLVLSIIFCWILFTTLDSSQALYALSRMYWPQIFAAAIYLDVTASDELADTNAYNKTWPRPQFHLLVDARSKNASLCRTLLSAVVQGYPPPILVGYGTREPPSSTTQLLNATLRAFTVLRLRDEDIVLWLGKDHWLQLPVEVTVRRYLQASDVINQRLAKQYAAVNVQQRILFPAAKRCSYDCNNTNTAIPESTLPRDVYGSSRRTSRPSPLLAEDPALSRPRFLSAGAMVGRVKDVTTFLKTALEEEKPKTTTTPHSSSLDFDETAIYSTLLQRQELARAAEKKRTAMRQSKLDQFRALLLPPELAAALLHENDNDEQHTSPRPLDDGLSEKKREKSNDTAELGITLDYESRIFQSDVSSSTPSTPSSDLQFLTFDRPNMILSPSRSAPHLYRDPVRLPPELSPLRSPLQHVSSSRDDDDDDVQQLRREVLWSTVELATNIAVPRGSIPAVLDMRNASPELAEEWWESMWFAGYYGRLLLKGYLQHRPPAKGNTPHISSSPLTAERAGAVEEAWNERGGKGGFWTGQGMLPILYVF